MNDFIQPLSEEFKDIFFIKAPRNGKYPYSHSLLIGDYLIDTGISSRLLRKLKREFQINNVLLSHWHEDHTSGNRLLRNVKFFIHKDDEFLIKNINKINEYYGISDTQTEDSFEWLMQSLRLENTEIEKALDNREVIAIGEFYQVEVIHTPGHTAGHCAFVELNSKIAFLADIDLTSFVFYAGIDSNLIDFENSLKTLKDIDIEIAITSHLGVVRGSKEIKKALDNYQSIIDKRDQRILSCFSEVKTLTLKDLNAKNLIYKHYSDFKNYEIVAEMIMLQKHFDKFLVEELIQPKDNGYILN
ncbi:MAG TPA: MBL fold metallo-hydrolase [archaeon]|nr:MBL fold metallo-hydrolase [archaeon]